MLTLTRHDFREKTEKSKNLKSHCKQKYEASSLSPFQDSQFFCRGAHQELDGTNVRVDTGRGDFSRL